MAIKMGGSKPPVATEAAASSAPSWMKKGKAAQAMLEKEEAKVQKQMEDSNKMRRFYIPNGAETKITFLDGKMDKDDLLDAMCYLEHNIYINGSWKNWFPCTSETEPCPICEGDNEAKLVYVFTVIDHSEWKSEKTGKVYKDQRKLFVCKRNTFKMLQKKAAKHGGLAGCTFDVSRTGDKEASVGNDFDFVQKRNKAELIAAFPVLKDEMAAANYEIEIPYYTANELRESGFGKLTTTIGNEPDMTSSSSVSNYDDDL